MARRNRHKISDEMLYDRILEICAAAGAEKSVNPTDIAMDLLDIGWQALLPRIRVTAVHQAQAGLIQIMRKGRPADPEDFKGVYKLRLVPGVDVAAHLADPTVNKGSGVREEEA